MERLTLKKLINAIFLAAIIVLVLCSVFTYRETEKVWDMEELVTHTHVVIERIHDAVMEIVEGERQEQSYLNSGDKTYLEAFQKALVNSQNIFNEVKVLTQDNPRQQERLETIEPLLQTNITLLTGVEQTFETQGKDAAIRGILSSKEQHLIEQIRETVRLMTTDEIALLKLRNAQLFAENHKNSFLMLISSVTCGLFLIICFLLISHQEQKNIRNQLVINKELEKQNKLIQQATKLKSEFLANMSHELRTPLNAVIGFSELMQDGEAGPVTPEQNEFLDDILSSARHLLRLINDVLDLSKVEAGKIEFNPEIVNLRTIVNEVADILRLMIRKKRINFISTVDDDLSVVYLDPARFKQIVYNFLSNALKFTPELGTVKIHIKPESSNSIRIEVEDNGIGIKTEDMKRLFVEFEQLDASITKKYAGTGLGLALTKRIVEAQGGEVGVTSIAGKGSIFYATLPLLKQVDSQLVTQSAQKYKRSPIKATTIQTILVIEDDKSDLEWVTNILIANGYVVETAQSGAVALQQTDDRIFDLITLDLILPDTNGYEILRKIRLGINVDTPVIIITAASERNQSMGFLVSDYLVKPIDKEKLLAALNDIGVTANDHRKILVIDDDKKILKLVNYLLRDEGFDLHCVSSPEEGLDLAQEIEPDVIVLDLLMPEMNGFDFIRHLRERQLPKDIPIIVWTVKDLTGEERTFLENSVQGVVLKTLSDSTDQLLKEIKKLTKK